MVHLQKVWLTFFETLQKETTISQVIIAIYVTSPYLNDAIAYGHVSCSSRLTNLDCATCENYAKSYLINACYRGIGAQTELVDCLMRYEQYLFSWKKHRGFWSFLIV